MFSRPTLKRHLTAVSSEDGWLLHGGDDEMLRINSDDQHRQLFDTLLPLLDGQHTLDEIVEKSVNGTLEADSVRSALASLAKAGLIEDADQKVIEPAEAEHFRHQLTYFGRFAGEDGGAASQQKLKNAAVDVLASGPLGYSIMRQLQCLGVGQLRILGGADTDCQGMAGSLNAERSPHVATVDAIKINLSEIGEADFDSGALLIVAMERWDPALLGDINARAIEVKRPWMLVQMPGVKEGTVGPLFVPPETACYACLESRLLSHLSFHAEYQEVREYLEEHRDRAQPTGSLQPAIEILGGWAALEATKFVTGFATPLTLGSFVNVNWFHPKMQQHHVLRVPRCLVCRPPRVHSFPWEKAPVEPREEGP